MSTSSQFFKKWNVEMLTFILMHLSEVISNALNGFPENQSHDLSITVTTISQEHMANMNSSQKI